MDRFALSSHQKAIDALDSGNFNEEIVPVTVKGQRGETTVVKADESPRRDTSLEALSQLPPVLKSEAGRFVLYY
jgi:acetyl-CoA acetyltransferase